MTNVLVTGGAGFIASHLTDLLLERGDSVLVVDNFATARRDTLPRHHDNLRLEEHTIADTAFVDGLFDDFRPDVVVHAAASYKDPEDWDEDARTNAVGTANIVQASERTGVGRLVYFQTALCYGLHPDEQPITLSHHLDPSASSYAISKTAGEWYVRLILLDPSKTEQDFDWAARTPLREGVSKAVQYFREHGVAETFTHLKPLDEPVSR